jgi:hypothetical protein
MAEVTTNAPKHAFKLDCGCYVKPGEQTAYHVVKIFTCEQTLTPLLRMLLTLHSKSQAKPAEKAQP